MPRSLYDEIYGIDLFWLIVKNLISVIEKMMTCITHPLLGNGAVLRY